MISKRLLAIADFIENKQVVADVGSDHCLLLCHLSKEKKLIKGYAMDVAIGPLNQAKENIKRLNIKNVECILSDGIKNIPNDVTAVVIAGMGFHTIKNIITNDLEKFKIIDEIIVQCNSEIFNFRKFLNKIGVNIIDEIWINDYKDYQVIKFNFNNPRKYDEVEEYFGPVLIKKQGPDFKRYYQERLKKLKKVNYQDNYLKEIRMIEELDNFI